MKTVITCLQWIRRGVAKAEPDKVVLSKEQLQSLIKCTKGQLDDLEKDEVDKSEDDEDMLTSDNENGAQEETEDGDLVQYDMNKYDQATSSSSSGITDTLAGLAIYAADEDDPYITLKDAGSDTEADDIAIKSTDNILVVGRAEEDYSNLEIYVYNEEGGVFYVHHDLLLSSYPLALEWIQGSTSGNMIAVGSMSPVIELWDLDLIDAIEPAFTLGQPKSKKKKTKTEKKEKKPKNGHAGAVLDLSSNRNFNHILASASADETIALWDLATTQVASTLRHHKDKVQTIEWHANEGHTLLSGGFDKIVNLYDCRDPDASCNSWNLNGEIERVLWNPSNTNTFLASTEDGFVYNLDVRLEKPVFTLKAHEKAVTGLALTSETHNCLTTVSADHFVKIWDITDDKPSLIISKDMKMGIMNCLGNNPDAPTVLAMGGENDGVRLLDLRTMPEVSKRFNLRTITKSVPDVSSNSIVSMEEEGDNVEVMERKPKKMNKSHQKEDTGTC
ncbi:periodic tryptophan protein 1 homolog isoform X2 [Anneissia japonica]|uniref:periodic tryptophan protein 1 homolog isoform X2 n=1 Tax=Anneissia japonica TaxID=1529436 RepID=UPI0014258FC9|nr:periodic tryptophan protein 1 homolog isoform X2 [Anneissia japonica]